MRWPPLSGNTVSRTVQLPVADKRKTEIERFAQAIEAVRATFPGLRIEIPEDHPYLEALAEIPQQTGLDFCVGINLQMQMNYISRLASAARASAMQRNTPRRLPGA